MMNAITDNIFLGGVDAACSLDYLTSHGVTHVLTVCHEQVTPKSQDISYYYVQAYDHPDSDLLSHFDDCFQFIDNAVSTSFHEKETLSKVLVHCMVGVSRSATILAAYFMRRFGLTAEEALERLREKRNINPNVGFLHQLELYQYMGNRVDKRSAEYRAFKLKMLALEQIVEIPEDILPDDDLPNDSATTAKLTYRCRKCRRHLFTKESLMPHQSDAQATVCSENLFISPVRWMLESLRQHEGKLMCPNCDAKVGAFCWAGQRCGCGAWMSPAFYLQICKLDCPILNH